MSYRTIISEHPFPPPPPGDTPPWQEQGGWRCRWISIPGQVVRPAVIAYRSGFSVDIDRTERIHVTADERYALYLDGELLGRGPERGDPDHWYYETYDLPLKAGDHTLVAVVWSLGGFAPWAQRSVRHGLLIAPQDRAMNAWLGTGIASWQARPVVGRSFENPSEMAGAVMGVGPAETIDASTFPWGIEAGHGERWVDVEAGESGNNGFTLMATRSAHRLAPATLPPMLDRAIENLHMRQVEGLSQEVVEAWIRDSKSISLPANSKVRIVLEVQTYSCFYPYLTLSGGRGAKIKLCYAEASWPKARRGEVIGKMFKGLTDTYLPDGSDGRLFSPLWWRCGRYIEVSIETVDQPLEVGRLELRETRYPLQFLPEPKTDSPDLQKIISISRRTAELCCHETYMDCPYYEQLMYIGDTRIQALISYVSTNDIRPAVKAMRLIDSSRTNFNGLPTDAAPADSKFIPPFALIWIGMVFDFAMYRNEPDIVRSFMPGVRSVLDRFLTDVDHVSGLVRSPQGWNFVDWTAAPFRAGIPPGGELGRFNASLNLQFLQALQHAAELETWIGEPELAARWGRFAKSAAKAIRAAFFDSCSDLFAESIGSQVFSEHAQCLALLTGISDQRTLAAMSRQLASRKDLVPSSLYFTHYAIEALSRFAQAQPIFDRIAAWYELAANQFHTTPEVLGETRSDCHAWSAHPLYHAIASIAGIRPGCMGFQSVVIQPLLGPLKWLEIHTPHPVGTIHAKYAMTENFLRARIDIDADIEGEFRLGRAVLALRAGKNDIQLQLARSTSSSLKL